MVKKHIVWFEEVHKDDVGLVGGKGANLGEMTNAHLPIPYGFVVTSHAYFSFIKQAELEHKIKDTLSIVNYDNPHELMQASAHIRQMIIKSETPKEIADEIISFYDQLPDKEEKYFKKYLHPLHQGFHRLGTLYDSPLVAVRSSATAEDLPTASFAGQQETYLNVKGEASLIVKVKECWASLFTERAIYYRHNQGFDHFKVGLATVVQRMVQSEKSGIGFSIDPVTNEKNTIVIEAIFGLGEYIVQGKVNPDHYEVDKKSFIITEKEIKYQNLKYVRSGHGNKEVKLNKKDGSLPKLTDEEITKVAFLIKDIEHHYFFPQDIEWAIEKDRVFVVQARPITTIERNTATNEIGITQKANIIPVATGSPASPGIGVGPANIIFSPDEIDKIKRGDILVAPQTNPDYVPAMKKASAIITEKGGRTSHAAIVSRELGIPAVVGAEGATKLLKHDQIYSVNGSTGEVFLGSVLTPETKKEKEAEHNHKHIKTLTKVYANLAEPSQAKKIAELDVDGIGLLRAEFIIAAIGTHPKEFIRQKKEHIFVHKLTQDMLKFVEAFSPKPVIYRATDFKTSEYRNLKGGILYEPQEENPMLGFRGASRYVTNPDVFALELQAIKKIWEKGYRNLHLMIPFVRVPWELIRIKEIIQDYGFNDLPGFKLWMMVEVPSSALQLEEFLKIGVDGVSIGTNDLTMMTLGVDRDSVEVAHLYDERNPVVLSLLERIVTVCNKFGVTCSICGEAASDYPDLVEKLVAWGITSVSVNPDAIDRTRSLIYSIEKKQFQFPKDHAKN
jgi:pyruvate, water dikinase